MIICRWWALFRNLAVPTVVFLVPIVVVRELQPLSYFLGVRGAIAELALDICVLLLLEGLCAVFLALPLAAGRILGWWSLEAESGYAGSLTFAILITSVIALLEPLGPTAGQLETVGIQAALVLAAIAASTRIGWRRVFSLLDSLNRSSQAVLALCPLLLFPVLAGSFGWRCFDPIPRARQVESSPSEKPNVIVISFDALTAEDMSLYGYQLPSTPQFERLARNSYNFVNFFSTSDLTSPAVASLLTGQYPLTNRVFELYGHIPPDASRRNLAGILRQHGYVTAAIVTNPAAHPLALWVEDSFSSLPRPPITRWLFPGTFLLQLRHSLLYTNADAVILFVLKFIGAAFPSFNRYGWVSAREVFSAAHQFIDNSATPYFLWLHIYPPHAPYVSSSPFRGRFLPGGEFTTQAQYLWQMPDQTYTSEQQPIVDQLRMRYDESVAEADSALGEFLDWLNRNHRRDHVILIVTADHGESFNNGWFGHGSPDLHYAETHIPLLISLPGQSQAYAVSEEGDLTDIAPTLLAILGVGKPNWMEGHSLLPPTQSTSGPSFSMYLAGSSPLSRPAIGTIAANSAPYHLVLYFPSGRVKLFNVARDPHETRFANSPGVAPALVEGIERRFGEILDSNIPEPSP